MLDHAQVRGILPQGHPMVLVDRVVSLESGASIVALKAISGSEPCFAGRSSSRFAFPVALLLESFGQAAALLWLASRDAPLTADEVLMLVTVRDCRIERAAFPGDTLRHQVFLDNIIGDNVIVRGETWVDDRRIAVIGSMVAAVRPRSLVLQQPAHKETKENGDETRRAP